MNIRVLIGASALFLSTPTSAAVVQYTVDSLDGDFSGLLTFESNLFDPGITVSGGDIINALVGWTFTYSGITRTDSSPLFANTSGSFFNVDSSLNPESSLICARGSGNVCDPINAITFYRDGVGTDEYAFTPLSGSGLVTNPIIVAPIPVPAAVWLFGSGLLGLIAVARRKKTA